MLADFKIPTRLELSASWTALMFCYVYGDYFGLYPPGQLMGMPEGAGPLGATSQSSLVTVHYDGYPQIHDLSAHRVANSESRHL